MISIDEAYVRFAQTHAGRKRTRDCRHLATDRATGTTLAAPVHCRIASPPFDASAMDGIALRIDPDTRAYPCIGTIAAGDPPEACSPGPGTCVRIMTGAPVPADADTVVKIEEVRFDGDTAHLLGDPERGRHIRRAGENHAVGDILYPAGTRITPGVVAGLLSQGIRTVAVWAPLRIGIAATGDELVDYRRPLQPGQIYNSNAFAIAAALEGPGVSIQQLGVFSDRMAETRDVLAHNLDLDLIVLSGGVSMGAFDLVPEAAGSAGFREVFHKIAMKPGKPLWFGEHPDGGLFFGLPGNPVSALVGTLLFIRPMIEAIDRGAYRPPVFCRMRLDEPIRNPGNSTVFAGAQIQLAEDGPRVSPLKTSGSGDVTRFGAFEALIRMSPGGDWEEGDEIQVLLPFQR